MLLSGILLAFLSGVSFSVLGMSYKMAAARHCRAVPFTMALGLSAGVVTLFKSTTEATAWGDPHLWGLAGAVAVCFISSIPLVVLASRLGPGSLNWTVVNLALLVPLLSAPYLFHEPLLGVDALVIALFVLALVCLQRGMHAAGDTPPRRYLLYALVLTAIFVTNGTVGVAQKLKYLLLGETSTAGLAATFYLLTAVLAFSIMLARGQARMRRAEWQVGALAGLTSAGGVLSLMTALRLPAAEVFPISQGLSLVGGIALTAVLYHERFNKWKVLGVALALAVVLLAVLREPTQVWLTGLLGG
ncbi:MAG TPA: hypothetical protein VGM19_15145 [Armatimonadota bacterium]|jgi:multidrug transporter EmrE-like cation transporter